MKICCFLLCVLSGRSCYGNSNYFFHISSLLSLDNQTVSVRRDGFGRGQGFDARDDKGRGRQKKKKDKIKTKKWINPLASGSIEVYASRYLIHILYIRPYHLPRGKWLCMPFSNSPCLPHFITSDNILGNYFFYCYRDFIKMYVPGFLMHVQIRPNSSRGENGCICLIVTVLVSPTLLLTIPFSVISFCKN